MLAEGLIYPMFDESCIVDELPEKGEYYVSCDYGTLNPFSEGCGAGTARRPHASASITIPGARTKKNKTDEEYADEIKKLIGEADVKKHYR